MFKKIVLAASIALAFATSAHAGAIVTVDANGAAPGDSGLSVGAFGWNNGNAITVPVTGSSVAPPTTGQIVQTYGQAALANFIDGNGNTIGGTGLNSTYEYTYVFGTQEVVTQGGFNATFATVAGGNNFFQVYYDPSRNSNNLAGTGFNNGTLILSGNVLTPDGAGHGISTFTATSASAGQLDQFGVDNYPNIASVSGNGSARLQIGVTSYDTSFFAALPSILALNFDTFQNLPYQQQNPSAQFYNGSGFIPGATIGSVGAVNGLSGPNVLFETRATNDFNVLAVPEPGSLALLGIGLAAVGGLSRRRRRG